MQMEMFTSWFIEGHKNDVTIKVSNENIQVFKNVTREGILTRIVTIR